MATAKKSPSKIPVKAPARASAKALPKAPVKAAAKPAVKPGPAKKAVAPKLAPKVAVKPAAAPKAAKPAKAEKPKKPKLVRDSFTIPKAEYVVLDDLKQRAARLAAPAKKSELLRAGIKALAAMSDVAFLASLGAVPAIKTGRPTLDKA